MARSKNKKEIEEVTELSEKEVWDIVSFATSLAGGGGIYPMNITPMMLNQRMKDINLNPVQATEDTLTSALADIKNSETILQSFSQDFEIQSQLYRRILAYLQNMLSFDLTYECINAKQKDYTSPKYQKDLDIVKEFFDRFDYIKEFRAVVGELLRNEAHFSCVRFDGQQIVLQELPASPDYTMINGRWDFGLLFSFNLEWFMNSGVSIEMYPKFFAEKYSELFKGGIHAYRPTLSPELRGNSSWVDWQDIPVGRDPFGWVFKMNPTQSNRHPYFTGLFLDLIQQPLVRSLQKNINLAAANRLLLGQVGKLKDATVKERNQFDISPELLGKFLALVKSAISDSIKVAAAPLEQMQAISFASENQVYPTFLRNAVASSGVNANLIFTNENRVNILETQLSVNSDEQLMETLYPQFNAFLDFHINRLTKHYKFKFEFEGTKFFNNRDQRFTRQKELMAQGIVLPHKIAASMGMRPQTMIRMMEESKAMGFVDKLLTPVIPGTQLSGDESGRPTKKDGDLSEAGEQTRADGENVARGAKV